MKGYLSTFGAILLVSVVIGIPFAIPLALCLEFNNPLFLLLVFPLGAATLAFIVHTEL